MYNYYSIHLCYCRYHIGILKCEGTGLNIPFHYDHYAVYCGDGTVVHMCGADKSSAQICEQRFGDTELKKQGFVQYHDESTGILSTGITFEQIVKRARSKVGQGGYDILFNNCEHFARWCATGSSSSTQVSDVVRTTGAVGGMAAAVGGAAMIGGAGAVAAVASTATVTVSIPTGTAVITGPFGVTLLTVSGPIGWAVGGGALVGALALSYWLTSSKRHPA